MFYDPSFEKEVHSRNLPHWLQKGCLYFVTFRLADSLPQSQVEQIRRERTEWQNRHRQPYSPSEWKEFHRLFSQRVEDWLDSHHGSCVLALPECGRAVAAALHYFKGERYRLDHWVIMPNHVHVLLQPLGTNDPADILHSWKSYTAHQINRMCGRRGSLWQHESFDHLVRSHMQLRKFRTYIMDNAAHSPQKSILSKEEIF